MSTAAVALPPRQPFLLAGPQLKRSKMSVTQTYYLAHKARAKLSSEAARPDHDLRLLVGHANLLDTLMLELADAEREQESWFNQSVRGATTKTEERHKSQRHVQWADAGIEEPEDVDSDAGSSDSEDDDDDEYPGPDGDVVMADAVSLRRVASRASAAAAVPPQIHLLPGAMDEEAIEDDDEDEDFADLSLSRTHSHSSSSASPPQPPELDDDLDEDDSAEDEPMPPSPPTTTLPSFSEKQRGAVATPGYYADAKQDEDDEREEEDRSAFYQEGFYLPRRNPARLVSAISVY